MENMIYRVTLTAASDHRYNEGWYFNNRGDTDTILYQGNDVDEARRVYHSIDMREQAESHNTAVERELVILDEDGNPDTFEDHYEVYDGKIAWWMVLTERSGQVGVCDEPLYRIDSEKSPYYVAAFYGDRKFERKVLFVTDNKEEMNTHCEQHKIEIDY